MVALGRDVLPGLPVLVPDRSVRAVLEQQVEARAVACESDGMEWRGTRLALRVRIGSPVQQHPHDLDVAGARIGRHRGMQGREAAVARCGARVSAGVEEVTDDVASLEESGEAERRVTVRRDAIRLSGIALDHLANAFGVAGGGRLEHGELRPSPKYRRRDV